MIPKDKVCLMCGNNKPLSEFQFIPRRNDWRVTCIKCDHSNPPYVYLTKYNIKPHDKEGLYYFILPLRICSDCGILKPISEFRFIKDREDPTRRKPMSKCRACYSSKKKAYKLSVRYDITEEEFKELIILQRNRCAICGIKSDKLKVDHDHNTGEVRGLLCHHCNVAIGFLNEDKDLFINALKYLGYD